MNNIYKGLIGNTYPAEKLRFKTATANVEIKDIFDQLRNYVSEDLGGFTAILVVYLLVLV